MGHQETRLLEQVKFSKKVIEEVKRSLVESEVRATIYRASAEEAVKTAAHLEVELEVEKRIVSKDARGFLGGCGGEVLGGPCDVMTG